MRTALQSGGPDKEAEGGGRRLKRSPHGRLLRKSSTISLREAATVLGISDATAYRLAEQGEFPVPLLRAGRRYLVPTQPLIEALGLAGPGGTASERQVTA